jgi:hypothetical protein
VIARGISRFLRNRQTEPPLTVAVTGEWGSGKSSLMGLLYEDLRGRGFRPVWFNAWHHQRGEHLLASLYASIRAQGLPAFWTPEGLGFRSDLFLIRAKRHWFWLGSIVGVIVFVIGYLANHNQSMTDLASFEFKNGIAEAIGKLTIGGKALLGSGLLTAIGALIGAGNALSAFGLDPKKLLGSLAMNGGGALKSEPGVRYRFAAEFADVTKALKPRTLVIFIDDLDRCTQEHVLEVLECINFLVTAGDCYIVLGMSRRWVETCVGLAFKELAAEAPEAARQSNGNQRTSGEAGRRTPDPASENDDPRDERRRFARQYLEKLINIEVPVPKVGEAAAASFLVPPLPEAPARRVRAARWLHARMSQLWLFGLLFGVGLAAYQGATMLPDLRVQESTKVTTVVTGEKVETEQPAGPRVQPNDPVPDPGKPATKERVSFSPGARDERAPYVHWGSAGLSGAALLILIGVLLGRRGRVQTDDSEDFRAALDLMRPWIVLGHPSPRLLKRYLNHVRFVAMRQRDDEEPASLLESALRRFGFVTNPTPPIAARAGLAEPELVALSALHQSRPDWQTDPEWLLDDYPRLKDWSNELAEARFDDPEEQHAFMMELEQALEAYNQRFPDHCLFADADRDRRAIGALLDAMAGLRIEVARPNA